MEIRYIDIDGALAITQDIMTKMGQGVAVIQKGNLHYCIDSARDIIGKSRDDDRLSICIEVAAFYLWCIGSNHIFSDGNKRTAYQIGYVFLLANGYTLSGVTKEEIVPLMIGITLQRTSKRDVQVWIRQHIKPISG